ncbi:MAG: ECF transporter S component [Bacilli bacterium]
MKKNFVIYGMLIALCVVLSFIKIPAASQTVSLDSTPAFFAAMHISSFGGGIVGFFAHLISASINGFPLGIPIHLIIAVMMFISVYIFGLVYNKFGIIPGIITAVIMNGIVSIVPFIWIINYQFFYLMIVPLTIASLINVIIAIIIEKSVKKII